MSTVHERGWMWELVGIENRIRGRPSSRGRVWLAVVLLALHAVSCMAALPLPLVAAAWLGSSCAVYQATALG